ncbi:MULTISPECIES: YjgN family protein [Moraxella]|uniref:Thymidylate kinase n=1 Tax=Moraxella catarrhalis TaxID=480 RepID=A0A7Z1A415_MORCA|nr:YjgN family protein [Moraxella catarrhalis]OAV00528.1 Thymidylate kinase [Moraxella catarrhalis]STY82784.1 Inner membrane protein yjgN [Moraxella catarrhalis]
MTHTTPPPLNPHHSYQQAPDVHDFYFHGTGMGYFKIWIVNLVLTIITLGFYSPWAKVRRLRYFYGHTQINGQVFDFTANPKRILVGRLIALGIYLVITVFGQFSPEIAAMGSLIIFVVMPWIVRSTMRFRARNSQYNNVRFAFEGSLGSAYLILLAGVILIPISGGLLAPLVWWLFKRYQFDNTYFGQLNFGFHASIWDFYKATLLPILLLLIIVIVGGVFFAGAGTVSQDNDVVMGSAFLVVVGAFYLFMLLIVPLMQGYVHQAIWRHLTLGNNKFELIDFSPLKFALIQLTNYIAIIVSLGLLHPWAAVRIHRYKTHTLRLIAYDDFTQMTTPSPDNVSPLGEEIGDVFDFDISW